MNERTVNPLRRGVRTGSTQGQTKAVRERTGLRNDVRLNFPGGWVSPGRPVEQRRAKRGSRTPALRWADTLLPPSESTADAPSLGAAKADTDQNLHLLIVCDAVEQLRALQAALSFCPADILMATTLEEVQMIGHTISCDLVVVNVSPLRLEPMLSVLRGGCVGAATPILVEVGPWGSDPLLAGVLPRFRAMACSRVDVLKLVCSRMVPDALRRDGKPKLL